MSAVAVLGWSALTSAGVGADALADRLAAADVDGSVAPGVAVGDLYPQPLPAPAAHTLPDFDVRARLGRKGTSSFDRNTGLAVVCCQDALRAAGVDPECGQRARIGVAVGTSLGSFRSTSDYSRETLIQDKPYLVNPMLFPNTVMNCAAGQVAIRFGLRGINATIAGGTLGFLNTLRYARNVLERAYADVMLVGAVEEYTPHRAWAADLTGATTTVPVGEAAAVFVLSRAQPPAWAGTGVSGRIHAVCTGYGPGGAQRADRALSGCVARAVRQAGVDPAVITTVLTGEADFGDEREFRPVIQALGHRPRRVLAKRLFGECDAASGAVALAIFLAEVRAAPVGPPGRSGLGLITSRGPDGAVGAAIVEGRADAGPDRG